MHLFRSFALLGLCALAAPAAHAQTQDLFVTGSDNTVSRYAGTGPGMFSTTAAAVATPSLNQPVNLTFDTRGDLFIADTVNNQIVELTAGASPGTFGATETLSAASLSRPEGLAFDAQGNLFVANFTGVGQTGSITEFAAGGASGTFGAGQVVESSVTDPDGLAFDAHGDLFVANSGVNSITEFLAGATSGTFGPATTFSTDVIDPRGLAFDARGDLFAANQSGSGGSLQGSVTEFMAGAVPGTFGMTTVLNASSLISPNGIAVDALGDVFVADYNGASITEFAAGTTPGDFSPATVVETGRTDPSGVAFSPAAVPEASPTVSLGLLLLLGGAAVVAKRKKADA